MTDEDQQDAGPQTGVVYLDWQVYHEGQEGAQRVGDVAEVEVIEGVQEHDQGELVLHQPEGTAVFDRNELRGFRAQAGVTVPPYARPDPYTQAALKGGRPTGPCECGDCECDLHTYEDDERCIWCENDQHAGVEDGA